MGKINWDHLHLSRYTEYISFPTCGWMTFSSGKCMYLYNSDWFIFKQKAWYLCMKVRYSILISTHSLLKEICKHIDWIQQYAALKILFFLFLLSWQKIQCGYPFKISKKYSNNNREKGEKTSHMSIMTSGTAFKTPLSKSVGFNHESERNYDQIIWGMAEFLHIMVHKQ